MMKNLMKFNSGKFYTIIRKNDPEYKQELKSAAELTDEEYNCIDTVINEKMDSKQQVEYTTKVFGKPAMITSIF